MDNNVITKINMINNFLAERPQTLGIFGYGSGVIKQMGYNVKDNCQIDLILVVENDKEWHHQNIKLNPHDYSFTSKVFFLNAPETWYHIGTDICYIPNIKYNNQEYKLGIITKENLINDLLNWKTFYLAGRFQKPMLSVKSDGEIDAAIKLNQRNALITSFLLLENTGYMIKKVDLYNKICSLSYIGDTRMGIAENPKKVENIVDGSFMIFDDMYSQFDLFNIDKNTHEITWDLNKINNDMLALPLDIVEPANKSFYTKEELIIIKTDILNQLTIRNRDASAAQTLKGLLTAGPTKSFTYAYKKIKKHYAK